MPFGFPSGSELVEQICNASSDHRRSEIAAASGKSCDHFVDFVAALQESARPSVDAFLEHRTEFLDIGKAAIAYYLIKREIRKVLFWNPFTEPPHSQRAKDRWYDYLFQVMGSPFDDFDKNQLSIITFNYERSLEEFLFSTLKAAYGKPDGDVAAKLSSIPIVHVYGKLCALPWESADDEPKRPYDSTTNDPQLIGRAAESIKIISEHQSDTPELERARRLIVEAENVYFLGFGYHKDNMNRLGFPLERSVASGKDIGGTCFGMTEDERQVYLSEGYPNNFRSLGETAKQIRCFLRTHERWLRSHA